TSPLGDDEPTLPHPPLPGRGASADLADGSPAGSPPPTTYSRPPAEPARPAPPRPLSRGGKVLRWALAVVGVLVLIAVLGGLKAAQIGSLISFGKQMQEAGPPPEPVGAYKAETQEWEGTLEGIGSVASSKGVTVSTEVPGTITRIDVASGDGVKVGQVLIELGRSIERAQLTSAQVRKDLAGTNVSRTAALATRGAASQQQLDTEANQLKAASAEMATLQAQIAKKTIRAPFAGKLGIRDINLGQYLNPGTPVAVLESVDSVYVDFTLPQQRLGEVQVGMPVRVKMEDPKEKPLDGKLAAIEPSVEQSTRSVKLRAAVPQSDKLRPGMFVDVEVVLPHKTGHVVIPQTALVRAAYGNSVFILEDMKPEDKGMRQTPDGKPVRVARQQLVQSGGMKGDFVAILKGLPAGAEVVSTGAFKLRNGAAVFVTDKAIADPRLAPTPENR
ncbi:MAG: efflux RND transporter periplasmic adaptor subunit, partial [Polyangiaceae bacterium]